MDTTNEPVKPAIETPAGTRVILSIGSRDFQLAPQVPIESAVWMMRLLSLGTCAVSSDYDTTAKNMVRTVGPREIVALQLVPAMEGEVAK